MFNKKRTLSTLLLSIGLLSSCASNDLSGYYSIIGAADGIEVYTHVLCENNYEFGFMTLTSRWKTAEEVNRLIYVSLYRGKDIIKSYGGKITEDNLSIRIVPKNCTDEDIKNALANPQKQLVYKIKNLLLDN